MMLAAGVAVLLAGLALVRPTHSRTLALDRMAVAVAPFRVSAADKSLGSLQNGMVDLLAVRLSS